MPSQNSQTKELTASSAPTALNATQIPSRSVRIVDNCTGKSRRLMSGSRSSTPGGQTIRRLRRLATVANC